MRECYFQFAKEESFFHRGPNFENIIWELALRSFLHFLSHQNGLHTFGSQVVKTMYYVPERYSYVQAPDCE